MVNILKTIGYVNTFLIVINSENPRFDEQLKISIQLYIDMFSDTFLKHVLVCFTHFKNDPTSIEERNKQLSSTDKDMINDF